MEKGNNGELPISNIRREKSTLGHHVYRKMIHIDRYLHKNSNHHSAQQRGILKTLGQLGDTHLRKRTLITVTKSFGGSL